MMVTCLTHGDSIGGMGVGSWMVRVRGGVGGRVDEHCAAHDIWRDGRVGCWMVRVRGGGRWEG